MKQIMSSNLVPVISYGVVSGELHLVRFGFGQLVVEEVDVINIAVHGLRSGAAPILPV